MNNREWLNSLSNEDFSKYLMCPYDPINCNLYINNNCNKCTEKWLESEHK